MFCSFHGWCMWSEAWGSLSNIWSNICDCIVNPHLDYAPDENPPIGSASSKNLLQSAYSENLLTEECLFGESTNCKVLVPITNQLQSACSGNPRTVVRMDCSWRIFSEKAFRSWWDVGTSILQLVYFLGKHFAVGGFLWGGINVIVESEQITNIKNPMFKTISVYREWNHSHCAKILSTLKIRFQIKNAFFNDSMSSAQEIDGANLDIETLEAA